MIAEIILIPDAMGLDAAKASAQYVARGLSSIGMKVRENISVCPDAVQFQQAVATALARSNILVTLGGMGKESGFLAKTVLSRGLGLPLTENAEAVAGLREFCRRTGERLDPGDSALTLLPKGAVAFPGTYGKIPGCAISSAKQHIIMLPETTAEIAPMFNKNITPYLGGTATTTVTRILRTYGMKESGVCEALGALMNAANPAVTVQREENEVLVRVSAHAATSQQAAALCTPVLQDIVDKLGDAAYGLDVDSLESAVITKLVRKDLDVAIAEGGTGGILTRVFAETHGGQDVLRYSVAVDTPAAKEQRLGVKQKLLKKWGNIGEYAAVATAAAAREKGNASLGISVLANTGEKIKGCPIGVVYIAVCDADNVYVKKLVVGDGDADPDVIVDAALSRALNMTRLVVDYHPDAYTAAIPLEEALNGRSVTELDDYEDYEDTEESVPDEKPSSFWGRFFDNFIVRKTDGRGVKVRKFVFIVAMLVFLGSAGYVGMHYYSAYAAKKQAGDLQNMFAYGDMEDVELSPDYPKNYNLKFAGLWNENPEVVAFISIPGTSVSYPIVQSEDDKKNKVNNFYLRRDFYGKQNQYGIPFMDYRVDVKKPSDNMVIYGHNMKDGQIFGELIPYNPKKGGIGYYKEHPIIECTTVYDESKYKIFSVFITNAYENQGPVFAYHDFIESKSGDDFDRYISELTRRSLINTTVDVKKGDKLLTLSTCTYEFQDARLVVVARAVRNGESDEVDTSGAVENPSPLMPDIWYKTFGGSKPIGESTAQVVTEPTVNSDPASALSQSVSQLSSSSRSAGSSQSSEVKSSSSSVNASDAALAREAESRAESRREQSRREASEAAASKAASDKAASEKAASDKAASERAESERVAAEKAASEKAASDKAASEAEEASRVAEEDGDAELDSDSQILAAISYPGPQLLAATSSDETLTVSAGGRVYEEADALDIISRIVQAEIGSKFHTEAIKAQAVAAYTYILHANASGTTPSVVMAAKADSRVTKTVKKVLGEAVYYKNNIAFTPYHATSAGYTTSSKDVWGGNYPYLKPVNSTVDKKAPNYKVKTEISRETVESLISQRLGIEASGDPSDWFEILTYADGDHYNGEMAVCGETESQITGSTITGRLLRENVFNLRSACFKVDYDSDNDSFIFTTLGYGHGVGMSQNGANLYAKKGWSYKKILTHYYPGTKVK